MTLSDPDRALAVARSIAAAGAADETAVHLRSVSEGFVRYADTGPTQSADRARSELTLIVRRRAARGLAEVRVTCGSLADDVTRRALARAVHMLDHAPPNERLSPFPGPAAVRETALVRPTSDHSFAEKAAWVDGALAACGAAGLRGAGLAATSSHHVVIATSAGRCVQGFRSRASFALTASGPSGSGFAQGARADVDALDVPSLIAHAVDVATRAQDPEPFEPGRVPVVLAPGAVSALLLFPAYKGFGAREVAEGTSFLAGRIGEQLFPSALSVADDAQCALHPGWAFDAEGSPRSSVPLVESGVLRGPVTDRYWAERLGVANTGHATDELHTPRPDNLVVAPGDQSLEELVAGIDHGLFVNRFHYANLIEPQQLTLTGTTRSGTFRIERGRLAGPVRNLRFTQSLVAALASLSGVGCEREVHGALFGGEVVTPALRLDNFRFTSSTDF